MDADLARTQRMAVDARVREERRAQWAVPKIGDAAPHTAYVSRIEHRMRKDHRRIAAAQENFAHQDAGASPVRERELLVAIGPPQALKKHAHVEVAAARLHSGGERTCISQPGTIASGGSRRGLPEIVAGNRCHEAIDYTGGAQASSSRRGSAGRTFSQVASHRGKAAPGLPCEQCTGDWIEQSPEPPRA